MLSNRTNKAYLNYSYRVPCLATWPVIVGFSQCGWRFYLMMMKQASLKCEIKSMSPSDLSHIYLIETSIENMHICFPLLLYKPMNKETMVSVWTYYFVDIFWKWKNCISWRRWN